MKRKTRTIPIVSPELAMKLARPVIKMSPHKLTMQMLQAEPAVFGLAALVAKDTCKQLTKKGLPTPLRAYVFSQICYAGALCLCMMRSAQLKNRKGKTHG